MIRRRRSGINSAWNLNLSVNGSWTQKLTMFRVCEHIHKCRKLSMLWHCTVYIRDRLNVREDLHQHPVSASVLSETLFHRRTIFGSGIDDLTKTIPPGTKSGSPNSSSPRASDRRSSSMSSSASSPSFFSLLLIIC